MMNKKVKWTFIGLGIFVMVLIVAASTFFVFVFITTGINFLSKEFTPETKTPGKIEESLPEEEFEESQNLKETTSEDLIIDDLAYIKILCLSYMDDADPETDGIFIDISFYNSKGENISFYDIPIEVNIEFYAIEFNLDTGEFETIRLPVYEGTVEIDHSMRLSEMFGNYIRVPFEDINSLPDEEQTMGMSIVTVITPLQGEFEAKQDLIILEPY